MTVMEDLGVTEISYDLIKKQIEDIGNGVSAGCELPPQVGLVNIKISVNSHMLDLDIRQGANII